MKILVILASYNGEKYIAEQINSILTQGVQDIDILVSDDNSTDGTSYLVKELIKRNRNISLIKNINRSGSAALNFFGAIKNLTRDQLNYYDYFALSDQDDIWLPNKIKRAISRLKTYDNNPCLYGSNLTLWDERTNKKILIRKRYKKKFIY